MILRVLKSWYQKKYLNNEPIIFVGLMLFFYLIIKFIGGYIAPILAALVIAYLLDTFVNILYKVTKIKRVLLVYFVYIIFLLVLLSMIFILFPVIINQLIDFIQQASHTLSSLKSSLDELTKISLLIDIA